VAKIKPKRPISIKLLSVVAVGQTMQGISSDYCGVRLERLGKAVKTLNQDNGNMAEIQTDYNTE
jgi:hypothetical protein